MNQATVPSYHYPNKIGRIVLLSLEEVIGRIGVIASLNHAGLTHYIDNYSVNNKELLFRFDELSKLQQSVEQIYGPRAGRGIALRTGRACFKYGLREFGPKLGLTELAFRLMPLESKLQVGAGIFADILNRFSDQKVRIEAGDETICWHIERCPICWERRTGDAVCHLAVGILQESLYWVSGGKFFQVEEIACISKGDPACIIQIDKKIIE